MQLRPDQDLNCLLLQTKFSEFSYWNYRKACETLGHKTPEPPLGLLTVAAIVPQNWEFKLLDLNTREFCQEMWDWADIILIGGMLPQQKEMVKYIQKAKEDGIYIVAGGSDITSQPEIYAHADALVLGEGESVIPMWLESWQKGEPFGRFLEDEKPDVSLSPIPRFDLLEFGNYLQIGVQYSRGCPFNCEFCDIIELFGRKPRSKNPDQLIAELQCLYDLGYRGYLSLVDDNFIGNKRLIKREVMPRIIEWQRKHRFPYFFHTEASMNLADDKPLLRQMRAAQFMFIFLGIETPDPEVLLKTQKSQNTVGDITERINTFYDYGLLPIGGFIVGFDDEKDGTDVGMIKLIEETNICMAMVGLLVALPNTQLSRRLKKEERLVNMSGDYMPNSSGDTHGDVGESVFEIVDQTTAGLNFITKRPRERVLREFENVVRTVYDPEAYVNRAVRLVKKANLRWRNIPTLTQWLRQVRALYRLMVGMSKLPDTRKFFWLNFVKVVPLGLHKFELYCRLMGMYLHLGQQTKYIISQIDAQIMFGERVHAKNAERKIAEQMKQAAVLAKVEQVSMVDVSQIAAVAESL